MHTSTCRNFKNIFPENSFVSRNLCQLAKSLVQKKNNFGKFCKKYISCKIGEFESNFCKILAEVLQNFLISCKKYARVMLFSNIQKQKHWGYEQNHTPCGGKFLSLFPTL